MPGYGLAVTSRTGTTGASKTTAATSPAAQFYFYNASSPTSALPLAPGASTIIKSEETDKFCRLVSAPPSAMLVLLCDITDPTQATPLVYSSAGLTYNGQPVLPVGPGGQMAVLPPGATNPSGGISTLTPAGAAIRAGVPCTINTPTGYVAVGPNNAPVSTNASGTGLTPAEYLILHHAISSQNGLIYPGNFTYVQSEETKKFCRLVQGPAAGSQVVVCDLDTVEGATQLEYTGAGLSYNRQPLLPGGPGQALTLGGTAAISPTGSGTGTRFGGPARLVPLHRPPTSSRPPPKKVVQSRRSPPATSANIKPLPARPPPSRQNARAKQPPPQLTAHSRRPPRTSTTTRPLAKPPPSKQSSQARKPPPPPTPTRSYAHVTFPPATPTTIKPLVKPPPAKTRAQASKSPLSPPAPSSRRAAMLTSTIPLHKPPSSPALQATIQPLKPRLSPGMQQPQGSASAVSPQGAGAPLPGPLSSVLRQEEEAAAGQAQQAVAGAAAAAAPGRACALQLDAPCGGINMCGADSACAGHCCHSAAGTCNRHSAFTWTCQQQAASQAERRCELGGPC